MKYNPDVHHRYSIRLKDYDYSQAGAYFVTICTQNRECLFGEIVAGNMTLNDAGKMVQVVWDELPAYYPGIEIDQFIVMPNHFHGIVIIVGAGLALPSDKMPGVKTNAKGAASSAPTLGDVIRVFKSRAAININRNLLRSGQSLWQRNYYEHIIRNEDDLNAIREYIAMNPMRWAEDEENPTRLQR